MTKGIALYLHVHQPFRVKPYSVFDIGNNHYYFDVKDDTDLNNEKIFHKVAEKSYWPMVSVLQSLLDQHETFKLSLSITGEFIDQARMWSPELIQAFKGLVDTGRVEILAETYYHTLAFFYDRHEFETQVQLHKQLIQEVFGVTPTAFRNTELAYNDDLARWADDQGYKAIIAEGWDKILDWRSPNYLYRPAGTDSIRLLLKNYRLSDDIAFRYSDQAWAEWPLTADKYSNWISTNDDGPIVNLFMDFETFGEHQWVETGILAFFESFIASWASTDGKPFYTITEAATELEVAGEISMPNAITWADSERDLSAWNGNAMQAEALRYVYELSHDILRSGDVNLINDWRYLQTSDHFYYMATKWDKDADVHSYFSPYKSPYDAFIAYMNVIRDLRLRLISKGMSSLHTNLHGED